MNVHRWFACAIIAIAQIEPAAAVNIRVYDFMPLSPREAATLRTTVVRVRYVAGFGTPVRFTTEPSAVCFFEPVRGRNPAQFVADPQGIVAYTILPDMRRPAFRDSFLCRGARTVSRVVVDVRRSIARAGVPPTPRPLPVIDAVYIARFVCANGFDPRYVSDDVLRAHGLPPRSPDYWVHPERNTGWLEAAFTPTTSINGVPVPPPRAGANRCR